MTIKTAAIAALALASCATTTRTPPIQTPAQTPAQTLAPILAEALAQADQAYAEQDKQTLAQRLQRIDRLGARLLDSSQPDPRTGWRQLAPNTAPPMRGRALGPAFSRGIVRAGDTMATEQLFLSGQSVGIAVATIPQGKLRLRVIDADKRMVCEPAAPHPHDCHFFPTFTQRYRIELQNSGADDARYYLVVD